MAFLYKLKVVFDRKTYSWKGYCADLRKAYLKVNLLAGEAVSNIRTMATFCSEKKVLDIYSRELIEPSKQSFNRGQVIGLFEGISQFSN